MKTIFAGKTIDLPKEVTVEIKSRVVTVKGPQGELVRDFRHLPVMIRKIGGGKKLEVSLYFGLMKQLAALRTVCSHIANMVTGVTKRFRYSMRLVYAHHPITVAIVGGAKTLEIRNFMGEKQLKAIDMLGLTKIRKSEITKDEIILEGIDIDHVSRSAALIHQSCLMKNKDIRKFLDGIYVSSSGPIDE